MTRAVVSWICAAGVAAGGCGEGVREGAGPARAGRVAVAVAPLTLSGVGNVTYRLTVQNGASPADTVFEVEVDADRFGDGRGGVAYVGPCDAADNPNRVTIEILTLEDEAGQVIDEAGWRDPTPVSLTVACVENADVAVDFDLTILRDAEQGFFDVAVELSDIFCSAKLDCVDALLHNGAERDTTVVVAWACTAGPGQQSWLYMDPVVVWCSDGTQLTVSPGGALGNQGGLAPYFFQSALYRGAEALPGLDKCYANTAIGVDLEAMPADLDCHVRAAATAAEARWPMGNTPAGAVYPYVVWDVPIVEDGVLVCGKHAVDQPDSGVRTTYTTVSQGHHFAAAMSCTDTPVVEPTGLVCQTGLGDGDAVELIDRGGQAIEIVVGGISMGMKQLPDGYALATECCQDVCCTPL